MFGEKNTFLKLIEKLACMISAVSKGLVRLCVFAMLDWRNKYLCLV